MSNGNTPKKPIKKEDCIKNPNQDDQKNISNVIQQKATCSSKSKTTFNLELNNDGGQPESFKSEDKIFVQEACTKTKFQQGVAMLQKKTCAHPLPDKVQPDKTLVSKKETYTKLLAYDVKLCPAAASDLSVVAQEVCSEECILNPPQENVHQKSRTIKKTPKPIPIFQVDNKDIFKAAHILITDGISDGYKKNQTKFDQSKLHHQTKLPSQKVATRQTVLSDIQRYILDEKAKLCEASTEFLKTPSQVEDKVKDSYPTKVDADALSKKSVIKTTPITETLNKDVKPFEVQKDGINPSSIKVSDKPIKKPTTVDDPFSTNIDADAPRNKLLKKTTPIIVPLVKDAKPFDVQKDATKPSCTTDSDKLVETPTQVKNQVKGQFSTKFDADALNKQRIIKAAPKMQQLFKDTKPFEVQKDPTKLSCSKDSDKLVERPIQFEELVKHEVSANINVDALRNEPFIKVSQKIESLVKDGKQFEVRKDGIKSPSTEDSNKPIKRPAQIESQVKDRLLTKIDADALRNKSVLKSSPKIEPLVKDGKPLEVHKAPKKISCTKDIDKLVERPTQVEDQIKQPFSTKIDADALRNKPAIKTTPKIEPLVKDKKPIEIRKDELKSSSTKHSDKPIKRPTQDVPEVKDPLSTKIDADALRNKPAIKTTPKIEPLVKDKKPFEVHKDGIKPTSMKASDKPIKAPTQVEPQIKDSFSSKIDAVPMRNKAVLKTAPTIEPLIKDVKPLEVQKDGIKFSCTKGSDELIQLKDVDLSDYRYYRKIIKPDDDDQYKMKSGVKQEPFKDKKRADKYDKYRDEENKISNIIRDITPEQFQQLGINFVDLGEHNFEGLLSTYGSIEGIIKAAQLAKKRKLDQQIVDKNLYQRYRDPFLITKIPEDMPECYKLFDLSEYSELMPELTKYRGTYKLRPLLQYKPEDFELFNGSDDHELIIETGFIKEPVSLAAATLRTLTEELPEYFELFDCLKDHEVSVETDVIDERPIHSCVPECGRQPQFKRAVAHLRELPKNVPESSTSFEEMEGTLIKEYFIEEQDKEREKEKGKEKENEKEIEKEKETEKVSEKDQVKHKVKEKEDQGEDEEREDVEIMYQRTTLRRRSTKPPESFIVLPKVEGIIMKTYFIDEPEFHKATLKQMKKSIEEQKQFAVEFEPKEGVIIETDDIKPQGPYRDPIKYYIAKDATLAEYDYIYERMPKDKKIKKTEVHIAHRHKLVDEKIMFSQQMKQEEIKVIEYKNLIDIVKEEKQLPVYRYEKPKDVRMVIEPVYEKSTIAITEAKPAYIIKAKPPIHYIDSLYTHEIRKDSEKPALQEAFVTKTKEMPDHRFKIREPKFKRVDSNYRYKKLGVIKDGKQVEPVYEVTTVSLPHPTPEQATKVKDLAQRVDSIYKFEPPVRDSLLEPIKIQTATITYRDMDRPQYNIIINEHDAIWVNFVYRYDRVSPDFLAYLDDAYKAAVISQKSAKQTLERRMAAADFRAYEIATKNYVPPEKHKSNKALKAPDFHIIPHVYHDGAGPSKFPAIGSTKSLTGRRKHGEPITSMWPTTSKKKAPVTCPNCNNVTDLVETTKNTEDTHLIAIMLTPLMLCFVPYMLNKTRKVTYKCAFCNATIMKPKFKKKPQEGI